jgi:hypothetical protein
MVIVGPSGKRSGQAIERQVRRDIGKPVTIA